MPEHPATVEIVTVDDQPTVIVGNDRDPDTLLAFTPDEWDAFVAGARDGEFDLTRLRGGDADPEQLHA